MFKKQKVENFQDYIDNFFCQLFDIILKIPNKIKLIVIFGVIYHKIIGSID